MSAYRPSVRFAVGDLKTPTYTLQQMLQSNADDRDLCDWLQQASPGDRLADGAGCECVEAVEGDA